MSDETKAEYVPSQTQRFEISDDPYSQERLHALLDLFRTLKEEVPFFAGISLYGSLAKGKRLDPESAPKSDIDLVLFIDRDDLNESYEGFKLENKDFSSEVDNVQKTPQIQSDELDQAEQNQLNIEFAAEEFIKIRVKSLLNQRLNGLRIATYTECISVRDGSSMFRKVDNHNEEKTTFDRVFKRSEKPWDPSIGPPFMLDIGGGLSIYREVFFERLSQERPERANYLWSIVNRHIRSWERKGNIPPILEHSFPKTFEDAREYYQSGRPLITQLNQ